MVTAAETASAAAKSKRFAGAASGLRFGRWAGEGVGAGFGAGRLVGSGLTSGPFSPEQGVPEKDRGHYPEKRLSKLAVDGKGHREKLAYRVKHAHCDGKQEQLKEHR